MFCRDAVAKIISSKTSRILFKYAGERADAFSHQIIDGGVCNSLKLTKIFRIYVETDPFY